MYGKREALKVVAAASANRHGAGLEDVTKVPARSGAAEEMTGAPAVIVTSDTATLSAGDSSFYTVAIRSEIVRQ